MKLEQYRPSSLKQYGKSHAVTVAKNFLESHIRGHPLAGGMLLHGKPGVGKTTLVRCLARTYSCQVVDWNASEQVNKQTVENMYQSALSDSWNERPKLLFLDEVDHVPTRYQERIADMLEASAHPVLLACNHYDEIPKRLRQACLNVEISQPNQEQLQRLAKRINADAPGSLSNEDVLAASSFRELIARAQGAEAHLDRADDFDSRIKALLRGEEADLRPSEYHLAKSWLADNSKGNQVAQYDKWLTRYRDVGKPIEKYVLRAARSVQRSATKPSFPWSFMVQGEDTDDEEKDEERVEEDSRPIRESGEEEGENVTGFF